MMELVEASDRDTPDGRTAPGLGDRVQPLTWPRQSVSVTYGPTAGVGGPPGGILTRSSNRWELSLHLLEGDRPHRRMWHRAAYSEGAGWGRSSRHW
jgi:hypothetical protein